jgi:hypothetical protein
MKKHILLIALFVLNSRFLFASASPEDAQKIENLFSQLEQQPNLKPENLAALEKAKPLVIELKGVGVLDFNAQNWGEHIKLLDAYYEMDAETTLQLSKALLSNSLDNDYVRQSAVAAVSRHDLSIQNSRQLIDVMLLLDQAELKIIPQEQHGWDSIFDLKYEVAKTVGDILHLPIEAVKYNDFLTMSKSAGTRWLLKALELAKTIPANQGNLALLDADIAYIKEKSPPPQAEAPPPPAPITSAAPASTAPVAAPSPTVVEASPGESGIPLWIYGVIPLSIGCIVGIGFLFMRAKK